ncbi:MAG TPA: aldehyde ferredoxin oxidoreductase N-terminal domain-containing protein, partial [Calidithermus sp.]|nr:aldehyde ferredoxin oxidoreductase N-terminal domain-containing protein [Calidithermus sp.]
MSARARATGRRIPPDPVPAYAGRILRVDLTKRKCWAEPWSPEDMREYLGGVGLGALILYRET